MTLRRALGVAASDLYHQAWRLIVLNVLLGAAVVAVVLVSLAVPPAVVLAILIGPVLAAVMHCVVTLAQTEDLRLVGAGERAAPTLAPGHRARRSRGGSGRPRGGRRSVLRAGGNLGVAVCGPEPYLLLMFGVFQLALWPLAVFETGRPLRAVARDAARAVARRPLGFLGLACALLLVNAVGVAAAILPFLTLTISYSFLVSAHFALPKNPAREA